MSVHSPIGTVHVILSYHMISKFQTYLEQTKTKFTKHYKGMNPSKITTTVGLNRKLSDKTIQFFFHMRT